MSLLAAAALATLLSLAVPAGAAEKASPEIARGRATSSLKEISLRPVYIYTARGRRDPFVDSSVALTPTSTAASEFSITELQLVGFMELEGTRAVLFKHRMDSTSYILRGGKLYSPRNEAVPFVTGRIEKDREVLLVQGERKLHFHTFGAKR